MLIPSIDLQGGAVVQLVQGQRSRSRTRRVPVGEAVRTLSEGAGDRSRRRYGRRRQPALVRQSRVPPCRVGGGIRHVARAQEVLARGRSAGHRALRAVHGRPARPRRSRRARRGRGPRADHRRRGQPTGPSRHPRLERARHHGGRRGPGARALLRRIPLHPRRHGRPDGGTNFAAIREVRDATTPAGDRGRRHYDAARKSTTWTPSAWTR